MINRCADYRTIGVFDNNVWRIVDELVHRWRPGNCPLTDHVRRKGGLPRKSFEKLLEERQNLLRDEERRHIKKVNNFDILSQAVLDGHTSRHGKLIHLAVWGRDLPDDSNDAGR